MHRFHHLRREIDDNDRHRMYCGRVMTRAQYRDQDPDLPMCKQCDTGRFVRDRRMEEQAERLTKAGYLEEDLGPNRRWNEY